MSEEQSEHDDVEDQDEASGDTREPGDAAHQFEAEPDDDERQEIEADREERLDPDNRPDGVEVDNTQREFDAEKGLFTDADDYEEAEVRFPPVEEQAT